MVATMPPETCPTIDKALKGIEAVRDAVSAAGNVDLDAVMDLIEVVREANADLRENAEHFQEKCEELEEECERLKAELEKSRDEVKSLEESRQ